MMLLSLPLLFLMSATSSRSCGKIFVWGVFKFCFSDTKNGFCVCRQIIETKTSFERVVDVVVVNVVVVNVVVVNDVVYVVVSN